MSVLIKGMEMPKDGCHYTITIYANGAVNTGWHEYTAVEIPTPHGRLIDVDELLEKQFEEEHTHDYIVYADDVDDASIVVIEAEK